MKKISRKDCKLITTASLNKFSRGEQETVNPDLCRNGKGRELKECVGCLRIALKPLAEAL